MTPAYAAVLGLRDCPIDVGNQNIDGSTLLTHGMVLANFQLEDKWSRLRFLQETVLVAENTIEILLEMLFLTLTKMKINFAKRELS